MEIDGTPVKRDFTSELLTELEVGNAKPVLIIYIQHH